MNMRLRKEWGNVKLPGTTGLSRASSTASSTASNAAQAAINRQIRSMVPGQTIRGEIISRNGSEVQIRLFDDTVLQARVDQNMNLELGKNMTFEVRNNGSALTLSPLFTNVSADVNVMKAIDMAGLPLNETTISLTSQMMKAGLSVDRNTLLQVYREVTSFPEAEISDVIDLHRLGLPVTEENVNQMISYRNLNHQLLEGMNSILGELPSVMEEMAADGNLQALSELYQELFDLIGEGTGDLLSVEGSLGQEAEAAFNGEEQTPIGEGASQPSTVEPEIGGSAQNAHVGSTPEAAAGILLDDFAKAGDVATTADVTAAAGQENISAYTEEGQEIAGQDNSIVAGRSLLTNDLLQMISELPISSEEASALAEELQRFAQGELGAERFFAIAGRLLEAAQTTENGVRQLHHIFSGKEFREFMNTQLKSLWTLAPEEVAEPEKLENLYRRLDRQLKGLSQVLEAGGQTESAAYHSVTNLSQNINFLNQLNQMYAYIQLPLNLGQGEAHGELYVYTNKKNLSAKEGKISALLHLDMEHLGPVDVYVTLEHTRVNTRFYVCDDEMLDFLEAHMDILTERLAKRGYDCSFSMTSRGEEQTETAGLGLLMSQERDITLSQYAFDVRTSRERRKEFLRCQSTPPKKFYVSPRRIARSAILPGSFNFMDCLCRCWRHGGKGEGNEVV